MENITLSVKPSEQVKGFDKSLYIKFNKFDWVAVNNLKTLRKRFFNPNTKEWEIAFDCVLDLTKNDYLNIGVKDLPTDYDLTTYMNTKALEKSKMEAYEKSLLVNSIPKEYEFKTKPYEHQLEGVEYGLSKSKFILADEQGLGKTKEVIDIVSILKKENKLNTCLIIACVNSLKFNWQEEVSTHSNLTSHVLGNRLVKKTGKYATKGNSEKIEDLQKILSGELQTDFIITNIETLRNKECTNLINQLITEGIVNVVAVDEIHKCKDPNSIQGKALLTVKPDYRIAMSGTLVVNNPLDLYVPLRWIGKEEHKFYAFKNYYCVLGGFGGNEVVGFKHLEDLKDVLSNCMIRRLKNDVLDLPDKIRQIEYVEMNEKQKRLYSEVKMEIKQELSQMKPNLNPLAQLIRLRQVTGNPKMFLKEGEQINNPKFDRAEELIENAIANNDKVVLFSNWTSITDEAMIRFSKYNPAIITGEVQDRQEQVNKFMNDDSCKLIIGTIGAMGTGLTLTAASTVIFLDSPWARAYKEQAEDRCHRIGQTKSVNYYTIVCKDTIDENIEKIIYKKGLISDCIVDDTMDVKSMELALQLLD